jgi:phage recombination protein Bet
MASRLSVDLAKLLDTLKATVFRNATTEELMALVTVANEYDLNPFLKEIYAFPAKGGGIVPVVSVDGWNKMLLRQPHFDGIEFEITDKEDGTPHSCTATVYIKERSKPMRITEYFDEVKRNTDPWNNMPRRMLRNRTLCQASRMAFGFSGIYNEEEAVDVQAIVTTDPPPKLINSTGGIGIGAAAPASVADVATPKPKSAREELEEWVGSNGFSFDHLQKVGMETGLVEGADSIASFDEISEANAKRLLRAKAGLLAKLQEVKGGAA